MKRLSRSYPRLIMSLVWVLASSIFLTVVEAAEQPDIFVKRKGADKIIIFAHGILGDGLAAFTNETTHNYWPRLLADDPDMNSFDVLAINYDAGIKSGMSIEHIATVVRTTLTDL